MSEDKPINKDTRLLVISDKDKQLQVINKPFNNGRHFRIFLTLIEQKSPFIVDKPVQLVDDIDNKKALFDKPLKKYIVMEDINKYH